MFVNLRQVLVWYLPYKLLHKSRARDGMSCLSNFTSDTLYVISLSSALEKTHNLPADHNVGDIVSVTVIEIQ